MAFLSLSLYHWVALGVAFVLFKVTLGRVLLLWTAFVKIRNSPGRQSLWIDPFSPMGMMLGPIFPGPNMAGYHEAKFSFHKKFGATSFVSLIISSPVARPFFWLADSEAIRIVSSDRHTFQKDIVQYDILNLFPGGNVLTSEGADWKRHRLVSMSAFNEANVTLVWAETMRVVNEWFKQLDDIDPATPVDILHFMKQITLLVTTSAGFGKQLSLTADSPTELPPGCSLAFQSAVVGSTENVIFRAVVPKWFYRFSRFFKVPYLSPRALATQLAFDDLQIHMVDMIGSARADIMSGKHSRDMGAALLCNLVEANMNQDGDSKMLNDAELLSNIFTFLFAGHETSAHSLTFAFQLLALFPDRQQKLYEEVTHIWPADVPATQSTTVSFFHVIMNYSEWKPKYQDHKKITDRLEYTLACIRETLRLFPVAPRIPKVVCKDTILPGTYFVPGSGDNPSVETGKFSMAIPEGSIVCMDVWAMHMNTLYWGEDVEEFRPERFIDTESYQWPRHAFMPFSGGSRSCIGQRFAITEMIGIIASVVHRYRILVPDDLVKKSLKEQKAIMLASRPGITMSPLNARLKLSRRF